MAKALAEAWIETFGHFTDLAQRPRSMHSRQIIVTTTISVSQFGANPAHSCLAVGGPRRDIGMPCLQKHVGVLPPCSKNIGEHAPPWHHPCPAMVLYPMKQTRTETQQNFAKVSSNLALAARLGLVQKNRRKCHMLPILTVLFSNLLVIVAH